VETVLFCYKNHHNLIIRPDDIWTAILVQFSFYVNLKAEDLRSRFVEHEGRQELTVALDGGIYSADYTDFVQKVRVEVERNLKQNFSNWILPNFTTTTHDDIIANGVVLMASMQKYFEYRATVACGIPETTLLGTVADWKDIYDR
jgi:hypothetical protein